MKAIKENNTTKCAKEVIRKYYKYVENVWTQPALTAAGTMGGDSFAVEASSEYDTTTYAAYKVFDGYTTGEGHYYRSKAAPASVGNLHWITFYNPNPLKVSNISYLNYGQAIVIPISGTVYGSNDNSTWTEITTYTNSTTTAGQTWNIDLSSNQNAYNYYKVTLQNGQSSGYTICMEMGITAMEQTITEGTQSDYDFYKDVDVYKVVRF